ncbi:MAG: MFS transporter [Jatrophihabitantaceae bacterium]
MTAVDVPGSARADTARTLTRGTLVAAALAACVAQVALAIPAVFNGLFQQDLGTSSSQLTWISDAFLVPVTLLELTSGVIGDLFGRKRLLVGGALLLSVGELLAVLTPGSSASTDTRVLVLWAGQIIAGIGAAALFPTSLAMVAHGTHTTGHRARSVTIWTACLSAGGAISPVLGGLLAKLKFGNDVNASWRWGFLLVLLLGLISAGVSAAFAKNSSSPQGRSLDWPGQITIAVTVFAALFAVIQGPTSGWSSGWVVGGFIVAAVFLVAFIAVEQRTSAPLLRLSLFANRAFAVAAIATVFGMMSFLGTAYATSIRLSAIQGFSPLKSSFAFVLLNGIAFVQMPITGTLMARYNPRWILGGGAALIGAGDLWMAALPATDLGIGRTVAPLALVGIGFALAVASLTAVAVNTVPHNLAGMASGTTSLLRDLGFTLGPAVIGAVALSRAAHTIGAKIAGSPTLQAALAQFNAAPAHVPAAQRESVAAAVGAVHSGPLGANAVPAMVPGAGGKLQPFNPLKDVAFHALSSAYSVGYIVCGIAALVAAALTLFALGGGAHDTMVSEESLA